jgi:hypothetical protein
VLVFFVLLLGGVLGVGTIFRVSSVRILLHIEHFVCLASRLGTDETTWIRMILSRKEHDDDDGEKDK